MAVPCLLLLAQNGLQVVSVRWYTMQLLWYARLAAAGFFLEASHHIRLRLIRGSFGFRYRLVHPNALLFKRLSSPGYEVLGHSSKFLLPAAQRLLCFVAGPGREEGSQSAADHRSND
jgi:hypothetical protein